MIREKLWKNWWKMFKTSEQVERKPRFIQSGEKGV